MAEIQNAKILIETGKGHVVASRSQAHDMSGSLHSAKGGLASGAEALLEVIEGLKQVEGSLKSAADQGKGLLDNMKDAKKSFDAADATSSPFPDIRNMPVDLQNCHEWMQPMVRSLGRQERLTHIIGLLTTIHADITVDNFSKGINAALEMTNRVENQVAPEIIGRADAWDAML